MICMFGVDNRTTKDMDTTIIGIDISKHKMIKILNEILSIDLQDGVKFDLVDIIDIREDILVISVIIRHCNFNRNVILLCNYMNRIIYN